MGLFGKEIIFHVMHKLSFWWSSWDFEFRSSLPSFVLALSLLHFPIVVISISWGKHVFRKRYNFQDILLCSSDFQTETLYQEIMGSNTTFDPSADSPRSALFPWPSYLTNWSSSCTQIRLKVCEDCGGSGICSECNGEGFLLKKLSEEGAEKARLASKNMATRYTAGYVLSYFYVCVCLSFSQVSSPIRLEHIH